jgi:DNA-binding protein HU-beta
MALSKSDVVEAIAAKAGLSKADSERALNAFNEVVTEALSKGDEVNLVGYMKFATVKRAARTGRNPQTGATLQIPASTGVKISAGAKLKAAVK